MHIPPPLQQAINTSITAVRRDPQSMLSYEYRRKIYDLFKSLNDAHSHQIHAQLDIITARSVLPIWQNIYPDDPLPVNILDQAEGVLSGKDFNPASYEEAIETLHFGFLADWMGVDRIDKERALSACFAAACALRTASRNDPSIERIIKEHFTTEAGNFDEDYDTATWAVKAVATIPGGIDATKCLTFWEWWLNEAISESWNTKRR